jgi:hypothetical protein
VPHNIVGGIEVVCEHIAHLIEAAQRRNRTSNLFLEDGTRRIRMGRCYWLSGPPVIVRDTAITMIPSPP